jgi:hypothetical protein
VRRKLAGFAPHSRMLAACRLRPFRVSSGKNRSARAAVTARTPSKSGPWSPLCSRRGQTAMVRPLHPVTVGEACPVQGDLMTIGPDGSILHVAKKPRELALLNFALVERVEAAARSRMHEIASKCTPAARRPQQPPAARRLTRCQPARSPLQAPTAPRRRATTPQPMGKPRKDDRRHAPGGSAPGRPSPPPPPVVSRR